MAFTENPAVRGCFSTDTLPPALRLRAWQGFVRDTFVDVHVQPQGAEPFSSAAEYCSLDSLRLGVVRTQRSFVEHLAQGEGAQDSFMLHLQERGRCLHGQHGHQALLERGQVSLSDMSRPYRLDVSDDNRMMLAVLPAAKLRSRLPQAPDIVCQAGGRGQRAVALLIALLRSVVAQQRLDPQADPVDEQLEDIVLDLVGAAFRTLPPTAPADAHAQRRRCVQDFVARHLGDPTLRLGGAAATLGLSERQVQRAFAEAGTTFSLYLLEQRLQAAYTRLRREGPSASVTRIALDCGFNDLTYFGRAFRRRFGVSPRDARRP